jgi:hypothetical protein
MADGDTNYGGCFGWCPHQPAALSDAPIRSFLHLNQTLVKTNPGINRLKKYEIKGVNSISQ